MYCGSVPAVFLAKFGSEIPFFRHDENVVAGDDRRQEKHEYPGEIERQSNPHQNANAAEIEWIS